MYHDLALPSRVPAFLAATFAACVVAAVALPLTAAASDPNQLGLFYDQAATVNEIAIDPNTQQAL